MKRFAVRNKCFTTTEHPPRIQAEESITCGVTSQKCWRCWDWEYSYRTRKRDLLPLSYAGSAPLDSSQQALVQAMHSPKSSRCKRAVTVRLTVRNVIRLSMRYNPLMDTAGS